MAIKTAQELVEACIRAAQEHKTLYVMGCFGAPLNSKNKQRYCRNHSFNSQPERSAKIQAASDDTFGFDCVCFIKGLLWGWNGDPGASYGGAVYKSNGVPDIGADQMLDRCSSVSDDFSGIVPGELVWQPGHVGIYIGQGRAVECTDAEADGVQIQAVLAMGNIAGLPATNWHKHGKLPWILYENPPLQHYRISAEGLDYPIAKEVSDRLTAAGFQVTLEAQQATAVPEAQWIPTENAAVFFAGNTHYSSANATAGKPCAAGKAIITRILPGAKHPYHLVRTGKVGPYGWVDAGSFRKA